MSDSYDPYAPRQPKRGTRLPYADNDGAPADDEQDADHAGDGSERRRSRAGKALKPDVEASETATTVAAGQLRAFVERIERLTEEKQTIADDIKEVYAEAKATGFDTKAVRTIVKLRKMDDAERLEAEAIIDLYKAALGMR